MLTIVETGSLREFPGQSAEYMKLCEADSIEKGENNIVTTEWDLEKKLPWMLRADRVVFYSDFGWDESVLAKLTDPERPATGFPPAAHVVRSLTGDTQFSRVMLSRSHAPTLFRSLALSPGTPSDFISFFLDKMFGKIHFADVKKSFLRESKTLLSGSPHEFLFKAVDSASNDSYEVVTFEVKASVYSESDAADFATRRSESFPRNVFVDKEADGMGNVAITFRLTVGKTVADERLVVGIAGFEYRFFKLERKS